MAKVRRHVPHPRCVLCPMIPTSPLLNYFVPTGYDGNTPGGEYLANCYVQDFLAREQYMRLQRQQVYGMMMKSDHTFYITKKVTTRA